MDVCDIGSLEDVREERHEDWDADELDDTVDKGCFSSGCVCLDDNLLSIVFDVWLLFHVFTFSGNGGCTVIEINIVGSLSTFTTEVSHTVSFWKFLLFQCFVWCVTPNVCKIMVDLKFSDFRTPSNTNQGDGDRNDDNLLVILTLIVQLVVVEKIKNDVNLTYLQSLLHFFNYLISTKFRGFHSFFCCLQ